MCVDSFESRGSAAQEVHCGFRRKLATRATQGTRMSLITKKTRINAKRKLKLSAVLGKRDSTAAPAPHDSREYATALAKFVSYLKKYWPSPRSKSSTPGVHYQAATTTKRRMDTAKSHQYNLGLTTSLKKSEQRSTFVNRFNQRSQCGKENRNEKLPSVHRPWRTSSSRLHASLQECSTSQERLHN